MTTSINYGLTHPEVKHKLKDFIIALGKELSTETENNTAVAGTTVSVMQKYPKKKNAVLRMRAILMLLGNEGWASVLEAQYIFLLV